MSRVGTLEQFLTERIGEAPALTPQEAKDTWSMFRTLNGRKSYQPLLSPPSANHKLGLAGIQYGLSLAQARTSGVANTCPFSTRACRRACLSKNGGGRYDATQEARALKVKFLTVAPEAFIVLLCDEIERLSVKHGAELAIRLNVFSDIAWERVAPWLFERLAYVRFYDYTKDWGRIAPANYFLVFSASEVTKDVSIARRVSDGQNVAVVFSTKRTVPLPAVWNNLPVIDGDTGDVRDRDARGVVVGLRAKGMMRTDPFGMVRNV